jgi:hypothetical protein
VVDVVKERPEGRSEAPVPLTIANGVEQKRIEAHGCRVVCKQAEQAFVELKGIRVLLLQLPHGVQKLNASEEGDTRRCAHIT